MILRNKTLEELARSIRENHNKVVVYGAGVIGQVVVPYFVETYDLQEYVECFVDMDRRKIGQKIRMGEKDYEICGPELLRTGQTDHLLMLITNSRFYSVLNYLDGIAELDSVEGYIVPIMQISEMNDSEPIVVKRVSSAPLIPKKIHYCWFSGNPMPEYLQNCIATWREKCPDYEIIQWNETNYDVEKIPYTKQAYERGKYGFVPDVARLDILYEHGGIYIDTDVTLLKNLDELLYQPAFTGVEKWGVINMGGMAGAVPGHPMIGEILEDKKRCRFVENDGNMNMESSGVVETIPFIRHGMKVNNTLQCINDMTVYPSSVFAPYDYMSGEDRTRNWTVSRHNFYGGWLEPDDMANKVHTQEQYQQILSRINR